MYRVPATGISDALGERNSISEAGIPEISNEDIQRGSGIEA